MERARLLGSRAQAHLSFIGLVSRRSAQELRRLLRAAESRGYRLVLVSVCGLPGQHRRRSARPLSEPPPSLLPPQRLPLSPCIPLARALVTLLTFGLAPTAHVTATLRSCFRLFGAALDEAREEPRSEGVKKEGSRRRLL